MSLHHIDGKPVANVLEWNKWQVGFASVWPLAEVEHLSPDKNFSYWQFEFAEPLRKMCDQFDVPLEMCEPYVLEHQQKVVDDLEKRKWYLSQHAGKDVGVERTIEDVYTKAKRIMRNGQPFIELRTISPTVDGKGPDGEVETCIPLVNTADAEAAPSS